MRKLLAALLLCMVLLSGCAENQIIERPPKENSNLETEGAKNFELKKVLKLTQNNNEFYSYPGWTGSGDLIRVFAEKDNLKIVSIDPSTGFYTEIASISSASGVNYSLSPNGKWLIYMDSNTLEFYAYSIENKTTQALETISWKGKKEILLNYAWSANGEWLIVTDPIKTMLFKFNFNQAVLIGDVNTQKKPVLAVSNNGEELLINSYDPASPESKYTIQSMGGMNLSATHPKIDCNLFGYPIPQGNQQAFLINRYNPNGLIILRFGADNREVVEINTKYEIAVSAL